jgi:hypothetical protein
MRSVIYGAIITAFLASAGIVQAANQLDGKALWCHLDKIGWSFENGRVSKLRVDGYSITNKVDEYYPYKVSGPTFVVWWQKLAGPLGSKHTLNRETLTVTSTGPYHNFRCSISSKTEIFQKLDETYAAEKKKNKI